MIELFVSDNDATNGTIAVTWCVSHETLDLLAAQHVEDPHVVIVVSPEGEVYSKAKEYRKVVPLKDLMTYIEFRASGKNRISAVVSYKTKKEVKEKYLIRDDGEFVSTVLNYEGDDYASWLKGDDQAHMLSAPISVNVPRECFAPEPSAWEKAWVNHFFREKPIDQCHFRRRRMFAYMVQPFILLALGLVKFLFFLAATLIGSRGWSPKYLFGPLTYALEDSWEVLLGGSVFIRRLPEDKDPLAAEGSLAWYLIRKFCLVPLMPLVIIPISLIFWFHLWAFAIALVIVGGFILCVSLVASGLLVKVMVRLWDAWNDLFNPSRNGLWYLQQDEMAMIVCDGRKKNVSISALPAKKRTFALRFNDFKSKVCRPFSA